jgi:hypothetical protein
MFRRTGWLQITVAVLHKWMPLMALARVPTLSVRPLIMALRYFDPIDIIEISSYQLARVGRYGQGLPPVMLNFECLKL